MHLGTPAYVYSWLCALPEDPGVRPCPSPTRQETTGHFRANFYCTCCFATGQQHDRPDIYIYTYVQTRTHTTATLTACDNTHRACEDSKDEVFAISTGGRLITKITDRPVLGHVDSQLRILGKG